jgi:hypothetical protein
MAGVGVGVDLILFVLDICGELVAMCDLSQGIESGGGFVSG